MRIKDSVEKYGEEFTKKIASTTTIMADGKKSKNIIVNSKNFMHEDYIEGGLFTKRRKESNTTITQQILGVWNTERLTNEYIMYRFVVVRSSNNRILYELSFCENDMRKAFGDAN